MDMIFKELRNNNLLLKLSPKLLLISLQKDSKSLFLICFLSNLVNCFKRVDVSLKEPIFLYSILCII